MAIKIDPGSLVDNKFLGIPYVLGEKTFEGCDCVGLAILYFKSLGVDYEYDDRQGPVLKRWYEHNPARFRDAIAAMGQVVEFANVKKYDCLLFFGEESIMRFPSCLGVMVDDRHFLTATEKDGSFVQMLNLAWKQKFWGAIRLRSVVEKGMSSWD